jgi:hypothetical protein
LSHLVDTQGMQVADEQQRELHRQLRADQQLVEQAAARRRHRAILAAYAGLERKGVGVRIALILDELARHLRDLDGELRESVVEVCRRMARG